MEKIQDEEMIIELLRAVGMKAFVKYLYPVLAKDLDATVLDVVRLFPEYDQFTYNAQHTRLNKARKIFKNGWGKEALKIIANSDRVDPSVREEALEFLKYI